ncbi:hypothetical protein Scep_009517 [Stephania cephalantha]|uniref:Uncharacterized protein n=1 Tax=Stephania cephalantha TaxID=152367 RepID=A0AAP0JTB0_9MAGN
MGGLTYSWKVSRTRGMRNPHLARYVSTSFNLGFLFVINQVSVVGDRDGDGAEAVAADEGLDVLEHGGAGGGVAGVANCGGAGELVEFGLVKDVGDLVGLWCVVWWRWEEREIEGATAVNSGIAYEWCTHDDEAELGFLSHGGCIRNHRVLRYRTLSER